MLKFICMKEELKQQLHALVDSIDDEAKLQMLMEDAEAYLADTEEEEDDLTEEEWKQIQQAEDEIERGEYITWEEMKEKLQAWKER